MNTLSESELVLVIKSRAFKRLHIIQNEQGKFRITVSLNNQEGELNLVTYRKTPREWASLDRLAKHIHEKYGAIPNMTLSLYSGETSK